MEVAIRALSPGINDPGTAVLSLQSLSQLLAFRLKNNPSNQIKDESGFVRIITKERSFTDLFNEYIYPIWDYGKDYRLLINEMHHILIQLQELNDTQAIRELLVVVKDAKIKKNFHAASDKNQTDR